jgi:putative oxidoreductase
MKVVVIVARILLGLVFVVFGSNLVGASFGHPFLHQPPPPPGPVGQLMGGLFVTHFLLLIGLVQVIGGLLLLIGQYVTLGLVFLGPVIVCIDYFHLSVAHQGIPLAGVVTILWILVALAHKHHLAGIFSRTA